MESRCIYSVCGINCELCKHKLLKVCNGCQDSNGRIFWGICEIYECTKKKQIEHCGTCETFPCEKLKKWAAAENPERIDNLKKMIQESK